MKKQKILIISDHALSTSGVGVQSLLLIEGLLKTQKYQFLQLGAAIDHKNYDTVKVNENFYIKPIKGFGNVNLIRSILLNESPDALIIFSDPRFFKYLFEIEDEIHQFCPILWWHVWDNYPYPKFNNWMYESTDVINCHSYLTYNMLNENFHLKEINYIPHSYPKNIFYRLKEKEIYKEKERILGKENLNSFICLWVNRNCLRKRPGDVIKSWNLFLQKIDKEKREECILIMHTNPNDNSGHDINSLIQYFNLEDNVILSTQKIETSMLNILYNISDVTLNISYNEGFGLTTLESMMTGTPIIATKTGGLKRQVIDYRDDSENGVALNIDVSTINGNQEISYIYQDYTSCENIAIGIKKYYNFDKSKKDTLSYKVENYANLEFNYDKSISMWDKSIQKSISDFKNNIKNNLEVINC
tara:strand:- start:175 stop:1422 length:1248 start_codon:yes stop_codon:yes gene_type:complete